MAVLVVLLLFLLQPAFCLEGGPCMSTAELQAIGTALGIVVVAALSYIAAWVRANTRLLDSHAAVLRALPPARTPGAGRATDPVAGGGPVRAAPRWNQLADPLPDGTLPRQRWNECGEECCAMEISRQHGVPLSADALRALLGGPGRAALTSAADLVRCLELCNVSAVAEEVSAAAVAARLIALCGNGQTAIVLGRWVAPNVLHWILVTRADAGGCSANDPWEGRRRSWTWAAFREAYAEELVVSTRRPDPLG